MDVNDSPKYMYCEHSLSQQGVIRTHKQSKITAQDTQFVLTKQCGVVSGMVDRSKIAPPSPPISRCFVPYNSLQP